MKESVTRLDYCQYLLVSQMNYTLTNFADLELPRFRGRVRAWGSSRISHRRRVVHGAAARLF
jgi:hypothetical protein